MTRQKIKLRNRIDERGTLTFAILQTTTNKREKKKKIRIRRTFVQAKVSNIMLKVKREKRPKGVYRQLFVCLFDFNFWVCLLCLVSPGSKCIAVIADFYID